MRPSPWVWMPRSPAGSGCRPASRTAACGLSHSPQMFTPERGVPVVAGDVRGWSGARGGPLPALSPEPRTRNDGHDADDHDDGDRDVPADRPAARALRLAVPGAHGGALDSGSGTWAWRVAGYPLTLGRLGRASAARARPSSTRGAHRQEARGAGRAAGAARPRQRRAAKRHARAVVLDDHPVRVRARCSRPGRARRAPAGSYATRQPDAPQPPAEVDVLDVHEVPLVPSADRRRARAGAATSRRPTPSRRRAGASGSASSWRYRRVNAVRRATTGRAARARPRSAIDGMRPRRRVLRAVGVAARAGRRRRGRARRRAAPSSAAAVPGATTSVGVAAPRRPARASPRCRGSRPRAYPTLPPGVDDARRRGTRARSASTEPSREPLSTTTSSTGPALVVGEHRARRTSSSSGPAS